jgi:hypothetical protein
MFNEPALNTFDAELATERNVAPWRLTGKVTLPIRRLADILAEVMPPRQQIDLLTIDVEGRDLDVLESNDWTRFRPVLVLAETRGRGLGELRADPITEFLAGLGYELTAKTFNTSFMIDSTQANR